jgi:hypothetical protein
MSIIAANTALSQALHTALPQLMEHERMARRKSVPASIRARLPCWRTPGTKE